MEQEDRRAQVGEMVKRERDRKKRIEDERRRGIL
jgi:hypothetical protein